MNAAYELREHEGNVAGMAFPCPGCGSECWIHCDPKLIEAWSFDGNRERPTFQPSILNRCCGWHGYMTAGEFVKC